MKNHSLTFIRTLAEEYATKYNPDNVAPFPYLNVTREHKDLEVYFVDLNDEGVSGVTIFKDETFNILINNTKSEARQHFTLGHELGHYFLHKEVLHEEKTLIDGDALLDTSVMLYRLDDVAANRIEREANNFAASLIMPSHLVRKAWDVTKSIEECAKIFRVSSVAMSIRLTRMGLVED